MGRRVRPAQSRRGQRLPLASALKAEYQAYLQDAEATAGGDLPAPRGGRGADLARDPWGVELAWANLMDDLKKAGIDEDHAFKGLTELQESGWFAQHYGP